MLQTFVTFDSSISDDGQFNDSGDLIIPPGGNIAQLLSEGFRNKGWEVTDPEQHSFYGWSFSLSDDKKIYFWILLQYPGPWLLLTKARLSFFSRMMRWQNQNEHKHLLQVLKEIFNEDDRFSEIHWFTKEEYEDAQRNMVSKNSY